MYVIGVVTLMSVPAFQDQLSMILEYLHFCAKSMILSGNVKIAMLVLAHFWKSLIQKWLQFVLYALICSMNNCFICSVRTSQLGGIWNHPCPDEPLSFSGSSDDDTCEEHTNNQSGNSEQNPVNPSNLFSLGPESPARLKDTEDLKSKVKSVHSGPEADLDLTFQFPEPPAEDPETPVLPAPSVTNLTDTTSDSLSPLTPISPFLGAAESCAGPDAHYLFAAAQTFSAAQDLEAIGSYYDAFLKYKEGIGTLLQGVQSELTLPSPKGQVLVTV